MVSIRSHSFIHVIYCPVISLLMTYLNFPGEIELENIPIRKDALRHLDIPIQVVSGFVGRVRIRIPVTRLRSEPWVVVLEHLYGVLAPIDLDEVGYSGIYDNNNVVQNISTLKFMIIRMLLGIS